MAEESFMLLSLKEQQSKKLAQVIGSDTCRKMLEYLTEKEFSTETETANDLKMPLSTVHYNFKALLASGLVVADEYHYSGKGKEVPHYRLAKKFIIIAPKDERNVLDKLRKFWPLTALVVGAAAVIEFGQRLFSRAGNAVMGSSDALMAVAPFEAEKAVMDTMVVVADDAAPMLMRQVAENASAMVNATAQDVLPMAVQEASQSFPSSLTAWFLGGALFVILIMVVWEFVKKD